MESQVMRLVVLFLATLWTVETYSDTTSCLPCFNFYLESCDGSMKYIIGQVQLGAEYMQIFDSCYGCSKTSAGELPIIGGPNIQPGFNPAPAALVNNGITQPLLAGQPPNPYYGNPITGQNGFPNSGNYAPPGIPLADSAVPNFGLSGFPSTVINPVSNPGSVVSPGSPSTIVNPLSNPGSVVSPGSPSTVANPLSNPGSVVSPASPSTVVNPLSYPGSVVSPGSPSTVANPLSNPGSVISPGSSVDAHVRSFGVPEPSQGVGNNISPLNGYPTTNKILDCEPVSQVVTDKLPVQSIQPAQVIPAKELQQENIEVPAAQVPNNAIPRTGPLPNILPQINLPNVPLSIPQLQNIIPNPVNFVPNNIPSYLPKALQPLNYLPSPPVPQIPNIYQNPPSFPFANYGPAQGQDPAVRSFTPQNQPVQNSLPNDYLNYFNNYLYPTMNSYIQPYYNGLQRYIPNVGMNLTAGPVQAGFQAGQPIHPNPSPANLGVGLGANTNLNIPNTPLNAGLNANVGLPALPEPASLIDNSNAKEIVTNSALEENHSTPEFERVS